MSELSHYKYIDALRGIAFLGVLSVHAGQQVQSLPGGAVADAGKFGVQLFFLLSAVTLLRSVSVRSEKEHFPILNFFIRRFFRIAPLFWCGIAFYIFLNGFRPGAYSPNGIGAWHIVVTALFLHGWFPSAINSVVPGGWSIAVEMTFYLCLPFLARRIRSIWPAMALTFVSLAVAVVLNRAVQPAIIHAVPQNEHALVGFFLLFWFPSQLPVFLMGFVVYHCLRNEAVARLLAAPKRAGQLALMAVCGLLGLTGIDGGLFPAHIFYSAAFGALILALAVKPFALVVNPFTRGVGIISFSCYITHFAVLKVVAHFIKAENFASLPPGIAPVCHFLVVWTSALALTAAASLVTYHCIEKPGIKLGDMIIRRYEEKRGPLPAMQPAASTR